jgi:DNA-binding CsgD family transcriptional regulator
VTIVGLWIGYPFWAGMFSVITDQMAAYLLRLNARQPSPTRRPVAVKAWIDPEPPAPSSQVVGSILPRTSRPLADGPMAAARPVEPRARTHIERLTARQLEVVALLLTGMRYGEVAACLGISEGQVQRHVANAVRRAGLRNVNELMAAATAEGLVSDDGDDGTD